MTSSLTRSLTCIACMMLASACNLPFDSQGRSVVAVLSAEYLNPPHLVIPDRVQAGESVRLTLPSGGPNGCHSPDRVDVRRTGGKVRLIPYNLVAQGTCTQATVAFEHVVELRLDTPGTIVLEVVARTSLQSSEMTVLLSKSIVVQP